MRWSRTLIATLRDDPQEAEIVSHKLMVRAGLIRKLSGGLYSFMPLGLRALQKVSQIVREEMNRAGAQEILMPALQPAELWERSGRLATMGPGMFRLKDRAERLMALGPTHEEVVTELIAGEINSYRQLPCTVYQIQTKFRDEIRPRFGLMRGREFLMKDAYSFDRDDAGADISYKKMFEAYKKIFSRMALQFRPVEADSGSIGGNFSHEFMVLAETGEDTIAYCTGCDWSANIERAAVLPPAKACEETCAAIEEVTTPDQHTIEEVCGFLKVPAQKLIKTLLYVVDGKPVAALVRGDRELNEIKLKNYFKADEVVLASPEQVTQWTNAPVGFAGPVGFTAGPIVADHELMADTDWIAGANKADTHILHVDLKRDVPAFAYADLRSIAEGDVCPRCGKPVAFAKGIEVGHVFKLGTKYSTALNAIYLDENGKEQTIIMGCYGIGVSRVVAACIEQNNDGDGIAFPPPLAPFDLELLNLDPKNADTAAKADELYDLLTGMGLDVLLDDREERPGVKFKDADLIGCPIRVVAGAKGLAKGGVEVKLRTSKSFDLVPVDNAVEMIVKLAADLTDVLNK